VSASKHLSKDGASFLGLSDMQKKKEKFGGLKKIAIKKTAKKKMSACCYIHVSAYHTLAPQLWLR
jgi:hypothetical protein